MHSEITPKHNLSQMEIRALQVDSTKILLQVLQMDGIIIILLIAKDSIAAYKIG